MDGDLSIANTRAYWGRNQDLVIVLDLALLLALLHFLVPADRMVLKVPIEGGSG
jgi:hypothetical protein